MTTSENSNGSILASVAKHEAELLAQSEASVTQARDIVEQAHGDARKHVQAEESRLADEVAVLRRDAEAARQKAFDDTVAAAEKRLEGVRSTAAARVSEMAKDTLGLFLPGRRS